MSRWYNMGVAADREAYLRDHHPVEFAAAQAYLDSLNVPRLKQRKSIKIRPGQPVPPEVIDDIKTFLSERRPVKTVPLNNRDAARTSEQVEGPMVTS